MRSASFHSLELLALAAGVANGVPLLHPHRRYDSGQNAGNHTSLQAPIAEADYYVSLGPRPYYILQNMTDSELKQKLETCENGPFQITDFALGHRGGGTLQFPEETVENTMAGARMGAGVLECDVAFTSDRGLVCRHSLCDLHTTTDILLRPELAKKCTIPFIPASAITPAGALCCTSDITTAEFLSLCGKMDGFNSRATTPEEYQHGTPSWRTELYDTCGTLMTLDSYIDLVDSLPGYRNFTPELKTPTIPMPFNGYSQAQYARDMINTFIDHGIDPARVWPQSFYPPDIYQWIEEFPEFGSHAIYLDQTADILGLAIATAALSIIRDRGVNIIAPPFNNLLALSDNQTIVPSKYAVEANRLGFDIITWTFERSPPLPQASAEGDSYYASIAEAVSYDGQAYEVLDVLANEIGVKGVFSDWAATVVYFANCFGLAGPKATDYEV